MFVEFHFIWHYVYCGDLYHSSYNSRYRNGYSFYGIDEFLSAFTIGFGIDCVFTVLALLRRKQVFQKVQVQMEAFKKDFEAESQLRVQEAQEAFQEWMLSRPDLSERIEEFQSSLENFSLEAKNIFQRLSQNVIFLQKFVIL